MNSTAYPKHLRERAIRTALAELAVHFADYAVSYDAVFLAMPDSMGEIIAALWKTDKKDNLGTFVGDIFLGIRRHHEIGKRPVLNDFLTQLPRCINTGLYHFNDSDIKEMREFLDDYIPVHCFGPSGADEADEA